MLGRKLINIWNDVVEKVDTDYEGSRKEFWDFVGRRPKGKKKTIGSLRSDKEVSVTSTKGKLHVLQKHYKDLGRMSKDSDFDSEWTEQVETKVSTCSSVLCEDEYLDGELRKGEIERCICKLKNNKK